MVTKALKTVSFAVSASLPLSGGAMNAQQEDCRLQRSQGVCRARLTKWQSVIFSLTMANCKWLGLCKISVCHGCSPCPSNNVLAHANCSGQDSRVDALRLVLRKAPPLVAYLRDRARDVKSSPTFWASLSQERQTREIYTYYTLDTCAA